MTPRLQQILPILPFSSSIWDALDRKEVVDSPVISSDCVFLWN
jgi:hypothetical protein